MKFHEIKNNVFYCGLNDRDRRIFDELIPLEHGTTYNSYLVKGSEKVAIIDTMYPPKSEEYLKNLDENNVTHVDYIIANHGEQDHTGTIPKLLEKFPEAVVVTNALCKTNIMEMLLVPDEKFLVVKNEETLSLGDKTLKFITAPGVHWPDTMFTHIVEDNLLCTCDFLGAHYTFEDMFSPDNCDVEHSAKRYYAEIMMPFRNLCKKYTKQINALKPDMILPSHGPIYKNPDFILDLYDDWTADESKNLVLLPYVSMYNSTEDMIMYISNKLNQKGINTQIFDIVTGDLGDLATGLVDATTLVFGSSMVLGGPHPMAVNAAYLTSILKPKTKFAAFVGSYGWGGNLFGKLEEMFASLNIEMFESIMVKGKPKNEDYEKLDILIDLIYNKHKSLNLV